MASQLAQALSGRPANVGVGGLASLGSSLLDPNPFTNPAGPQAALDQAPIWAQAAQQPIDAAKAWYDWRMSRPPLTAEDAAMGFMPMGIAGITKAWRMPIEAGLVPFTRVIENPTKAELDAFLKTTKSQAVRTLRLKSGQTYAVDGYHATHQMLVDHLGIDPADISEKGTGLYLGDE